MKSEITKAYPNSKRIKVPATASQNTGKTKAKASGSGTFKFPSLSTGIRSSLGYFMRIFNRYRKNKDNK